MWIAKPIGVFGWTARLGFGSVGPVFACLVCRPSHLARLQEATRTARAWPRKKHGVGVSSGARLRPAPHARPAWPWTATE